MNALTEFKKIPTLPLLIVVALALVCAQSTARAQNFGEWGPAVSVDPDRSIGINTSFNDGCPIEGPDGHMLFPRRAPDSENDSALKL